MSNFVQFVPKHALDCQKNLNDFILRAKNELSIYEDQGGFASSNWKHRLANGRSQSMVWLLKGKKLVHLCNSLSLISQKLMYAIIRPGKRLTLAT